MSTKKAAEARGLLAEHAVSGRYETTGRRLSFSWGFIESFDWSEADLDEMGTVEDFPSEIAYIEVSEDDILEKEFPDMPGELPEVDGTFTDGTEGTLEEFPDYEMSDMEQDLIQWWCLLKEPTMLLSRTS